MTLLRQSQPLKVTLNDPITTNVFLYFKEHTTVCITLMICVHCFVVPTKSYTPAAQRPLRRPLSQCDSPVFVSDSDDEDDIVIKSTWRTRHSKPPPKADVNNARLCDKEESATSLPFSSPFSLPPHKTPTSLASPKRTLSAPSKLDESESSEEEFTSLLERLKKKNKLIGPSFSPRNTHGNCFIWIVIFQQSLPVVFLLAVRLISVVFLFFCSSI